MRVHPLTMTLTTAITAPAEIVNGHASMPAIGAAAVHRHAVGAEDAEAYGSVPSFVLIAEKCFSVGGLNWSKLA
jgi:hypothetical protein